MARKKSENVNKSRWSDLTRAEKDLYITVLWHEGYSDKAIAVFFGATKGTIVGFRHRHHESLVADDPNRGEVKETPPTIQRFYTLLEIHQLDLQKEQGLQSAADIWDENVNPNPTSTEEIQSAVEAGEGTVVPLRKTEPETAVAVPEILPSVEAPKQPKWPSLPFSSAEVLRQMLYRITNQLPSGKCEWPLASGKPCGKDAVPGHRLCEEHRKGVPKRGRLM